MERQGQVCDLQRSCWSSGFGTGGAQQAQEDELAVAGSPGGGGRP